MNNKQVCKNCIEGLEKRVTKRLNSEDDGRVWTDIHCIPDNEGRIKKVSYRVNNKKPVEHDTDYCENRCRFKLEQLVLGEGKKIQRK